MEGQYVFIKQEGPCALMTHTQISKMPRPESFHPTTLFKARRFSRPDASQAPPSGLLTTGGARVYMCVSYTHVLCLTVCLSRVSVSLMTPDLVDARVESACADAIHITKAS